MEEPDHTQLDEEQCEIIREFDTEYGPAGEASSEQIEQLIDVVNQNLPELAHALAFDPGADHVELQRLGKHLSKALDAYGNLRPSTQQYLAQNFLSLFQYLGRDERGPDDDDSIWDHLDLLTESIEFSIEPRPHGRPSRHRERRFAAAVGSEFEQILKKEPKGSRLYEELVRQGLQVVGAETLDLRHLLASAAEKGEFSRGYFAGTKRRHR